MSAVILRRLAQIFAVLLVAALLLIAFGPALYGPALLTRVGGPYQLSAASVSGPLWNVSAHGLSVKGPGVSVRAEQAQVGLATLSLGDKTVRLNLGLSGGVINLTLKDLFKKSAGSAPSLPLTILPGNVSIKEMRLNLNGKGMEIPNGHFAVSGSSTGDHQGQLELSGQTDYGDVSAALKYAEKNGELSGKADFSADARLINFYWRPGGVTAGQVTGQYRLSGGQLEGDFKLVGGAVRVPEAKFVEIEPVSGQFTHRGDVIQGQVSGQGLGGPVTAQAKVDLAAQRFEVRAQASPTLTALGKALKLPASGAVQLSAHISGWKTVKASAQLKSAQGQFVNIPYRELGADYAFAFAKGHIQQNTLRFGAQARLLGERQQIAGNWTFNKSGAVTLSGQLLRKPLNLSGQINAKNKLTVAGTGLGGPVEASYQLTQRELSATLRPDVYTLTGRLSVAGKINDLALSASQLKVGPLTFSGRGRLNERGLQASLDEAAGGSVSVETDRRFVGTWQADGLGLAGISANGSGAIDLTKGLSGQLSAQVPRISSSLSGPVKLNWLTRTGTWQAGQQRLSWNGETFGVVASNLKAAGLTVNGAADYRTDTRQASVQATTNLLGEVQTLAGQWTANQGGRFSLGGQLLKEPLNLSGKLDAQNQVSLQGRAVGGPVQANFNPTSLQLSAQLELSLYGVTGKVAVSGQPNDLAIKAQAVKVGPLTLSGQGQFKQGRVQANFSETGGGVLGVSGPLNDLAFKAQGVKIGPLTLAAQGKLNDSGLQASVNEAGGGTLSVSTNRQFVGTWRADALGLAGISANGSGAVDLTKGLSGQLSAQVPSVSSSLSGPFKLNWLTRTGTWQAGQQRLSWNGDTFSLKADHLKVQEFSIDGQAAYRLTDRRVTGRLTASGNGVNVMATGQGQQASLSGTVRGVEVQALSDLQAPFTTRVQVKGADLAGKLSLSSTNGINFNLQSGKQSAQGSFEGQNWNVTGGVDLAALRPLLGVDTPALSGNLQLNLAGLGGTAKLQASVAGAQVGGTLTRQNGAVSANLSGQLSDLAAQLSGQVYPQVQLSGPVTWRGVGGPQTVSAQLSGSYGDLRVRASGQTSSIDTGSVALPSQALRLEGSLTPTLALNGSWGDLGLMYKGGEVSARGQQTLSAAGQAGQVSVDATWKPDYSGNLSAAGQLGEYAFSASGPWTALKVNLSGAGLTATGRANARTLDYVLDVGGLLSGVNVSGQVRGQKAALSGTLKASDGQGGQADIKVNSLSSFTLDAQNFKVAGQTLQGKLSARNGQLSGSAKLGPLDVEAKNGRFTASGTLYQHQIKASGRLNLPTALSDLKLKVDGPYLSAQASGSGNKLLGSVRLKAQQYGSGALSAQLPAQDLPLEASLSPLSVKVGGLRYAGGNWSGDTRVRYSVNKKPSSLRLIGNGKTLSAAPQDTLLAGQVKVLPEFGGTLKVNLAELEAALPPTLLPASVKTNLVPGVLSAQLSLSGAALSLSGGRWQGEILGLSGQVGWSGKLTAKALLTLPTSRLPISYDGQDLRLQNAVLDAQALRPVLATLNASLADLEGQFRADVTVPSLDFARASGQAQVDLSLNQQAARGQLNLRGGQLSAALRSTLGGQALSVTGSLYPQADAAFEFGGVRGTVTGDARSLDANTSWTAQAAGTFTAGPLQGRSVTARASLSPQIASLSGVLDGLNLDLSAQKAASEWTVDGTFNAADLKPLTGQVGQVAGTLSGTLSKLTAQVSGDLAGAAFEIPAMYQSGVVTLQDAQLSYPLGDGSAQASLSGQAYPALDLSGSATLTAYAPGTYSLSASGAYAAPRLALGGVLTSDVLGFGLTRTRLDAVLKGQDFMVTAQGGPLAGVARGRTDAPNYLQTANLTLHAPYRNGDTNLQLDGPLSWNAKTGWGGALKVVGNAPGGALSAQLSGNGPLKVQASLGPAQLSGQFSASLPTSPNGSLKLASLDIGAFWQRPQLLRLSGTADLGGSSWADLSAQFSGQLSDADGQLSGDLSGEYAAGQAKLSLNGQALQGSAKLSGAAFTASLNAAGVTLSRLLPPSLGVGSLRLSGTAQASGSTSAGLISLSAQNLSLSGQQSTIGDFSVSGSARYSGGVARADLTGRAYGGDLSATGSFQNGLRIKASGLTFKQYGVTAASGDLVLRGDYANPTLSGMLRATRPEGEATASVSGQLQDPQIHLKAALTGPYSGTVYADAAQLNLAQQTAQLHLYGNVTQTKTDSAQKGSNWLNLDLRGVWPKLSGEATARLVSLRQLGFNEPIKLIGSGNGSYQISAGTLGSGQLSLTGLNPMVKASATLTPLALIGAEGSGQLNASLSGPLTDLRLAASGTFSKLSRSGVSLPTTSLSLSGSLTALRGEMRQNGAAVGSFDGQQLRFTNLKAAAAGLDLTASGSASLSGENSGEISAQVSAAGAASGSAKLTYGAAGLKATGQLTAAGFDGAFDGAATQKSGWSGQVSLSGGPVISGVGAVLSAGTPLNLSGPFAAPRLSGTLGLVGAQAQLTASSSGARLTLQDGPATRASGSLSLLKIGSGYVWEGEGRLIRPEGELDLGLSGEAANPQAQLSFRRGEWTAHGKGNLKGAQLQLSDGVKSGDLRYDGKTFSVTAEQLDLARLHIGDLSGQVSAVAALDNKLSGSASLSFSNLSSGAVLPYFELPLTGSGSAQVRFTNGKGQVQANVTAPYGQVALSAEQSAAGGRWSGSLKGELTKDQGRILADVTLDDSGAGGQLKLENLPLNVSNLPVNLNGTVTLAGQNFTLDGEAVTDMGRADVSGDGGIADLAPILSSYTVLKPSEAGYRIQVGVSNFDLAQLKLAQGISGAISGQLILSADSGSFAVSSKALKLGNASFPARIDGTLAGGDWRLRGYVGSSTLFGAVTNGQLSVRSQLEALPLGNIISGFTGKLPGNGIVTGIARLDAPLSDVLSGSLNVVAERVRVTAGTDTLIGSGTIDFRNRELRQFNLQLDGAGQWRVSGEYTRQKVNLQAAFINTTFTPVLAFVPSLSGVAPALKGSLTLNVGGTYEQPTATLSGSNLLGSVSGISVQVPSLSGQLGNDGQFTAQAAVQASGNLGTVGTLRASGQFASSQLSATVLRYQGTLSADLLGNLGTLDASLTQGQNAQNQGTWTATAAAQQGGTLSLSGQVSPSIDVKVIAQNYNLPIRSIYARESSLNAALSAKTLGEQIVISGQASFDRLILGRVGAASLPGTVSSTPGNDPLSNFVSPLPDELTVFPSKTGEKPVSPFLQRVVLQDIPITAPNGIRVDENLAQAELSAALTLSGTGASPRLSGNVKSLRGNLLLRDNNFNLQNASANFDGSSLYPVFSLTAQGRVPDQSGKPIGVQLQADGSFVVQSGARALKLDTELSCTTCASASDYSQAELYSLLALGTPDITTVGSNIGSLGQSAISTALNLFVLSELQRNIARALGVDVFRISSNLITPEGNLDAKFTVGTYLSKQFYIQYQVDLTGKGLFDATYTTDDNRFTFRVSTPISGLDLQTVRPSLTVGYNFNANNSLTLGVQSGLGTRFSVGYLYKW
ncbi:hypothetical protein EHF33_03050 [Deinococcus psychrotolerans]|uniref:Translocation/assembly module TamB n=1 Tax=Deinococcus psychrotolerans TaxID=2489213 RepID=A0A3G8Y915_9DEIO|nr:hypothetical protein [Deinococcus psychrotolerans]AZI41852.1 hypothetical protein EHF33_03050 [Deinococcus psychrotolerans]